MRIVRLMCILIRLSTSFVLLCSHFAIVSTLCSLTFYLLPPIFSYKGNYDNFKEQEAIKRKQQEKDYEKQEKKLR